MSNIRPSPNTRTKTQRRQHWIRWPSPRHTLANEARCSRAKSKDEPLVEVPCAKVVCNGAALVHRHVVGLHNHGEGRNELRDFEQVMGGNDRQRGVPKKWSARGSFRGMTSRAH